MYIIYDAPEDKKFNHAADLPSDWPHGYFFLEFLTEDEVEVRAAFGSVDLVETVSPVDTHHADHREIDADTGTGAALELEGREVLDGSPGITSFDECQTVDGGGGLEHEGEVEFHTEAGVGIAAAELIGGQLTVIVTAEGDGLLSVGIRA